MSDIEDVLEGRSRWTVQQGDCLEVMQAIPDGSVDCVVTDPPFGLGGKAKGNKNPIRRFVYGEWDMEADLSPAFNVLERVASPIASYYIFCGFEQISDFILWLQSKGCATRALCWIKKNPSPVNGEWMWIQGAETIAYGRKPGGVFNRHCAHGVWFESPPIGTNRYHPTQKPLDMMVEFIEASSRPNDIIFDPFCGSGTTGVAALRTDRRYIGIEQSEEYCGIARRRITEEERFVSTCLFSYSDLCPSDDLPSLFDDSELCAV